MPAACSPLSTPVRAVPQGGCEARTSGCNGAVGCLHSALAEVLHSWAIFAPRTDGHGYPSLDVHLSRLSKAGRRFVQLKAVCIPDIARMRFGRPRSTFLCPFCPDLSWRRPQLHPRARKTKSPVHHPRWRPGPQPSVYARSDSPHTPSRCPLRIPL